MNLNVATANERKRSMHKNRQKEKEKNIQTQTQRCGIKCDADERTVEREKNMKNITEISSVI